MSKFRIYRIDHHDPPSLGRRKRVIAGIYALSSPIFVITFNVLLNNLDIGLLKVTVFFVLPFLVFYLLLYYRLRSDNSKIKRIGEVEFTQSGINKKLGDSSVFYNFSDIRKLELTRHIPAVTTRESKSGYFSYIVGITFRDGTNEYMIVSDRPTEKEGNISVSETFRTLKKISQFEVDISKIK